MLTYSTLPTPLGEMIAIADEKALHLLAFDGSKGIDLTGIPEGETAPIRQIREELNLYFQGKLWNFQTPLALKGTPFQKRVWEELCRIPTGETRSYAEVAAAVDNPKGHRAVARANATNKIVIVIPCHRVIRTGGELGGYGGSVERKLWLLNHEATCLE